MTKKKKTASPNESSSSESELNINLELDLKALRSKNKRLAQSLATLMQDKSRQQYQINSLKEEYYKLNSKYVNLQNTSTSVGDMMRECLPLLLKVVNMFTQLMHVNNSRATFSSDTPNKDARTHTVKPQIVNGHVLHNPTINISRLNGNVSDTSLGKSTQRDFHNGEIPSTSRNNEETTNSEDDDNTAEIPHPPRRRNAILETINSTNNFEDDVSDDSDEDREEQSGDKDSYARLTTVQEEDEGASHSSLSTDNWRDVRIVLNQMSLDAKDNQTLYQNGTADLSRSSLICQTSNSMLDNVSLLEDMSLPPTTSRDISEWSNEGQSPIERVCLVRGGSSPKKVNSTSYSDSTFCSTTNNLTIRQYENGGTSEPMTNNNSGHSSKMKCLGLEPDVMTSTPVIQQSVQSRTSKSLVTEFMNSSQSPVSKIAMKPGGSGKKKTLAKVILQRITLEKRLSGSPIKKAGEILDVVPITRSSDIKRTNLRPRRTTSAESDNGIDLKDDKVDKMEKMETRNTSKGKENEVQPFFNVGRSPRPRRAARPTKSLVEPSLTKKMRRNK